MTGEAKIPPNWNAFLQDNINKKELFGLLTSRVANFQFPENKEVNITSDEFVVTSRGSSDMQRYGHLILARTVDTDVLVILIGLFHDMIASYPSTAIWIGLGMGKYV